MIRDWVVNSGTWVPYDLPDLTIPFGNVGVSEFTVNALTRGENLSNADLSFPQLTSRMVATAVRGYIHCHLDSIDGGANWSNQVFGRAWRLLVSARITRYPQEPSGTLLPAMEYDLGDLSSANDQFVWHREKLLVNRPENEWAGTPAVRTPISWSWPVQVKFRRVLEEMECMAVMLQVESGNDEIQWQAPPDLQVRFVTRLRTFLEVPT